MGHQDFVQSIETPTLDLRGFLLLSKFDVMSFGRSIAAHPRYCDEIPGAMHTTVLPQNIAHSHMHTGLDPLPDPLHAISSLPILAGSNLLAQ